MVDLRVEVRANSAAVWFGSIQCVCFDFSVKKDNIVGLKQVEFMFETELIEASGLYVR